MTIYRIETIRDLFKVPAEKRDQCLKELGYALGLMEFAEAEHQLTHLEWTDDGDMSATMKGPGGEPLLSLKITEAAQ